MFGVLLAGAPRAHAAESGMVIAPGTPPLTRQAADASAEVTIFMLQVVATGDPDTELELDDDLLEAWAEGLAAEYSGMSSDAQAQLASLPAVRDALYVAWPQATASQRAEMRDAFRPMADGMLAQMGCDGFVSLADAGLVEPNSANIARYKRCNAGETVAAPAPTPVPTTTSTESPTAAYQRASAGLAASHNMYVNMSNVLLQNHVGNMNAILNMGNSNYRYEYVSKP
jgi:hypothetical protein